MGCFSFIRRETFDAVGFWMKTCGCMGTMWIGAAAAGRGWEVVFYPGARAIHDRGKTTAPYPVRFALAQQRSVLHYWSKHHSCLGVLGIRSIMLFHHLLRVHVCCLGRLGGLPSNVNRGRRAQAGEQRLPATASRREPSPQCLSEALDRSP